ncbi:hypothetical protein CA13_65510 [Planctomycetes bacterium CA13]|uniref:Uncharacterized protein n=1 Tax=Novipirellula herctigrandis TaxID=2527986 RepID=A0A5C5ZCC4_9BACT|nr:hypothetical protein CA13_65510 [Planctomycetes bacterium CA13]
MESRSRGPAEPYRYPINDDRYAGVGPWRHNTGLRLMPVNDIPDEPFPRTTFLVRPSKLLLPSACSGDNGLREQSPVTIGLLGLALERKLAFHLPPKFTTDNHPLHTEAAAARFLKSMSFAAAR